MCVRVFLFFLLHAASLDASVVRTPAFLNGASFHYPDDAEQAVKWIRGKVHELQRFGGMATTKQSHHTTAPVCDTSPRAAGNEEQRRRSCFALLLLRLFSLCVCVCVCVCSVRRAFEYTIAAVEEKWRTNFSKLHSLLDQRGNEIVILQRRLLTALGQTPTITGKLQWK